jgi:radical SAM superfamily enzyme YgiQ (UPF0313 family)
MTPAITFTQRPVFRLILIRPSKYDNDGYVVRYWRAVLPSNTLSALYSMTRRAAEQGELGPGVKVEMTLLDESAHRIDPARLVRRHRRGGARVAVGLVGVQSNQFPRASDLAREFRALKVPVMIGGFHVSGSLAMFDETPPELQALMDDGVTLIKGEVEDCLGGILRDVYEGRPKLLYDIKEKPDITSAPIPETAVKHMKKFAYPHMGTIDAGRGCPFDCSFCTIINVQGHKMRCRSAEAIVNHLRKMHPKGVNYFFFTDDNFARNKNRDAILDGLIRLREEEGLAFTFMMQVDTLAHQIKGFCERAARAGCSQAFIGVEAIREANLEAAGKRQNAKVDYRDMSKAWHDTGIAIHAGYIIGFPEDTPETVAEDVAFLKEVVQVDQASFFMLTPLPGSKDHADLVRAGAPIEKDFNKYDSFQPSMPHPKMSPEEWTRAYRGAWASFYEHDHMKERLLQTNERTYWGLFKNYIWYKTAVLEGAHPMIGGFFRLKDRTIRRPGHAVQGRLKHARMRAGEITRTLRQWTGLFFEFQELWLQTRPRRGRWGVPLEEFKTGLADLRERAGQESRRLQEAAGERLASIKESAHEGFSHVQQNAQAGLERGRQNLAALSQSLARRTPKVRLRDRLRFWSVKHVYTRDKLNRYWRSTFTRLRRGRIYAINPVSLSCNLFRDVRLFTAFTAYLLATRAK